MHGLFNRALQCFVRDTYGAPAWAETARQAGLPFRDFEPMLPYDDSVSRAVISAAANHLGRGEAEMLEDFGTYLVTHPTMASLRRLLRFGGDGFGAFLASLDDLRDRARLAMPDLEMPRLDLCDAGSGRHELRLSGWPAELAPIAAGLLRAMADDYGALALIEDPRPGPGGSTLIAVTLLSQDFAEGRSFELSARA